MWGLCLPKISENKDIESEFDKIASWLKQRESFAFVRYNDGEVNVLMNEQFSCKQWQVSEDEGFREALMEGLFEHKQYLIGIPCGCLEKKDGYRKYLRDNFNLGSQWLTFASIFSNSMFQRTQSELVPLVKSYDIVLVANDQANIEQMKARGFRIEKYFPIPLNAWQKYKEIQDAIVQYVDEQSPEGRLFLFCAGPVSNVLIHQLFKRSPGNTYLDVGSSFDKQLGLADSDRCYQQWFSWKSITRCYWDHKESSVVSCESYGKSKIYRLMLRLWAMYVRIAKFWKSLGADTSN